jgi:hypothetical protein
VQQQHGFVPPVANLRVDLYASVMTGLSVNLRPPGEINDP